MAVKGYIEGGGEFELSGAEVACLRDWLGRDSGLTSTDVLIKIAASLPPEPYVPQVGDRVQYREKGIDDDWWPNEATKWVVAYQGIIAGRYILHTTHPLQEDDLTTHYVAGYELRPDTREVAR